jgi:protein O-mannosyl-transferase
MASTSRARQRQNRSVPAPSLPAPTADFIGSERQLFARWSWLLPPLILIAAGIGAYFNSFGGVFLFDDETWILNASEIRQIWPFPGWPTPGPRSLVTWSLALNHATSGLTPWDYHAFNLVVHLLAGLCLYALVLGTLTLPALAPHFEGRTRWIALAVALIWVIHPLQTQSVTYIIQRAESLVSLFYLLVLLCLLWGARGGKLSWIWYLGGVLSCVLGMLTKEVISTAPFLALLYDRVYLSSSWKQLFVRRGLFYLALTSTLLILVPSFRIAFASTPSSEAGTPPPSLLLDTTAGEGSLPAPGAPYVASESGPSAGFHMDKLSWQEYARTQPQVILHYLQLVFWPGSLCLDYGWRVTSPTEAIIPALVVLALGLLSLAALCLRPTLGFVGVAFFVILAPSSSILPIADLAMEHRMYLALAAPVILGVLAIDWALSRVSRRFNWSLGTRAAAAVALLAVVTLLLGWRTVARNEDYRNPLKMWSVTVRQRPGYARPQINLSRSLLDCGLNREAEWHSRRALELDPTAGAAEGNLAIALFRQSKHEEAIPHARAAVRFNPKTAAMWSNLGLCLGVLNRFTEAAEAFRQALLLTPEDAPLHYNLGKCLAALSQYAEAEKEFRETLQLQSEHGEAHARLAELLVRQGKTQEAQSHFESATRLNPKDSESHFQLAVLLSRQSRAQEALPHFEATVQLRPKEAQSHYNLAVCLVALGRKEEARQYFRRAQQLDPRLQAPTGGIHPPKG